ncbi:MAG: hypothetical protein QM765_47590 [Myxococcales bacterium]
MPQAWPHVPQWSWLLETSTQAEPQKVWPPAQQCPLVHSPPGQQSVVFEQASPNPGQLARQAPPTQYGAEEQQSAWEEQVAPSPPQPAAHFASLQPRPSQHSLLWEQSVPDARQPLHEPSTQTWGAAQLPQDSLLCRCPHPSVPETCPQTAPWDSQNSEGVKGVQPSGWPASEGLAVASGLLAPVSAAAESSRVAPGVVLGRVVTDPRVVSAGAARVRSGEMGEVGDELAAGESDGGEERGETDDEPSHGCSPGCARTRRALGRRRTSPARCSC